MTSTEKTTPLAIRIAVYFSAFAILSWTLPNAPTDWSNPFTKVLEWNQVALRPFFGSYLHWTGLNQDWRLFSGDSTLDPNYYKKWISADILFQDGTVKFVNLLVPQELPTLQRGALSESIIKLHETLFAGQNPLLAQSASVWLARLNYEDVNNPPTTVRLYENWQAIPPRWGTLLPAQTQPLGDYNVEQGEL